MINDERWPYGFYGLTDANSGTLFATGVPDTGQGARIDVAARSRPTRTNGPLVQRAWTSGPFVRAGSVGAPDPGPGMPPGSEAPAPFRS